MATLLDDLLWLPIQGPLVFLCLCAVVLSYGLLLFRRKTSVRVFVLLALLPIVFCVVHVVREYNQGKKMAHAYRTGAKANWVDYDSNGEEELRPMTKSELAEVADRWEAQAVWYPTLDVFVATCAFGLLLAVPAFIKHRRATSSPPGGTDIAASG